MSEVIERGLTFTAYSGQRVRAACEWKEGEGEGVFADRSVAGERAQWGLREVSG